MGYDVDYGWNLFGRYAGLYLARNIGDDIESGLDSLVQMIATLPNFDYSYLQIGQVEVPAHQVLSLKTSAKRVITEVNYTLYNAVNALQRDAKANGLEAAGPVRLVTINFGDSEYKFEVQLPVAKPSADAGQTATDESAEDGDSEVSDEAAMAMHDVAPMEGLKLGEGVESTVSYRGPAIRADIRGRSPAQLQIFREALRSYVAAHSYKMGGYPFEDYLQPVTEEVPSDGDYLVYLPIVGAEGGAEPAPAADDSDSE